MELEQARIVIGIPTIEREHSYVEANLEMLFRNLPSPATRFKVVLSSADPLASGATVSRIRQRFRSEIESGLLELRHADNPGRAANIEKFGKRGWEANLTDDSCSLIQHCVALGEIYLHLEDDAVVCTDFWTKFEHWYRIRKMAGVDWSVVTLYSSDSSLEDARPFPLEDFYSTAALLFRTEDLASFTSYCKQHRLEQPFDLLLRDWVGERQGDIYVVLPSLVDHGGLVSSFSGGVTSHRSLSWNGTWWERVKRDLRRLRELVLLRSLLTARGWTLRRRGRKT
jgi:hypothetical protein